MLLESEPRQIPTVAGKSCFQAIYYILYLLFLQPALNMVKVMAPMLLVTLWTMWRHLESARFFVKTILTAPSSTTFYLDLIFNNVISKDPRMSKVIQMQLVGQRTAEC